MKTLITSIAILLVSATSHADQAPLQLPDDCAYAARSIMAITMGDLDFRSYASDQADGERIISQIGIVDVKVVRKARNANGTFNYTYGATLYDGKSQATATVLVTEGGCYVMGLSMK